MRFCQTIFFLRQNPSRYWARGTKTAINYRTRSLCVLRPDIIGTNGFEVKYIQDNKEILLDKPSNISWLALVDDFRTTDWQQIIPYPELTYQETQKYLANRGI